MSPRYRIELADEARRQLSRLPRDLREAMARTIDGLAADPRRSPPLGKSLRGGLAGAWRWRVRGWRILYRIDDERRLVTVREIALRDDAYKDRA